jgi:hypothetical protein
VTGGYFDKIGCLMMLWGILRKLGSLAIYANNSVTQHAKLQKTKFLKCSAMRNLIGSKDGFGIEYEIHPGDYGLMGNMRLWFGGRYVGSFDDVNILSVTSSYLGGLKMENGCHFINEAASDVYDLISDQLETIPDSYGYVCFNGAGFDDFIVYGYACDDKFYFVWKLVDSPAFEHPGYPKDVQSADVSIDEFRRVVAEYERIIDIEGGKRPDVKARKEKYGNGRSQHIFIDSSGKEVNPFIAFYMGGYPLKVNHYNTDIPDDILAQAKAKFGEIEALLTPYIHTPTTKEH